MSFFVVKRASLQVNRPPTALWKRALRWGALSLAVLVLIHVLVLAVIAICGQREWARTKADLLACGEKLSLLELAPPVISLSDDRNFFADRMWRELQDYVTTEQNGKKNPTLRIPPAKRQLRLLKEALPAPDFRSLQQQFPSLDYSDAKFARITIASRIWREASISPNADLRKKAAAAILAVLEPLQRIAALVDQLCARPAAQFPLQYEKNFTLPLEHISPLLSLGQLFGTRAKAELALGDNGPALTDTLDTLRLARTIEHEPLLICLLVRVSLVSTACSAVATGITLHAWRDEYLVQLQAAFQTIDLFPGMANALRGERGGFNAFLETLRKSRDPAGNAWWAIVGVSGEPPKFPWWRKPLYAAAFHGYLAVFGPADQADYNQKLQQAVEAFDSASRAGIRTASFSDFKQKELPSTARFLHFFSTLASSSLHPAMVKIVSVQTQILQTRIACALERYWLKNKTYPTSLDALVPDFLPKVPPDVLAGQNLHYQRKNTGDFLLWSVGGNGIDEGGTRGETPRDLMTGDWVWNQP